jgi:hypothetical protein
MSKKNNHSHKESINESTINSVIISKNQLALTGLKACDYKDLENSQRTKVKFW